MYLIAITFILAYLLGSVPSSVWIGKLFFNIDVREHGSKNAGATNTMRVLGKKPGFVVLFLDFAKGFFATSLPYYFFSWVEPNSNNMINWQIAHGAVAVIGHIYPIFAGFRGGKGIATLLGLLVALSGFLSLFIVLVFVITVAISKYISVGSMVSGLLSPVLCYFIFGSTQTSLLYFCCFAGVLVVYTHRSNIKRLMAGNETKFTLKNKPLITR